MESGVYFTVGFVLNRCAAPAVPAPELSNLAPTSIVFSSIDTEKPNSSLSTGAGLLMVCNRLPVVASNRYAEPTLVTLSRCAPTRTLLLDIDTEWPNSSPASGVGLVKFCNSAPVVALNRYAEPT